MAWVFGHPPYGCYLSVRLRYASTLSPHLSVVSTLLRVNHLSNPRIGVPHFNLIGSGYQRGCKCSYKKHKNKILK